MSGATSTATTGTFAAAAVFRTVPAAELSKGEKMMPLAPSVIEFFTPVICFAVSNSELNGCKRSTPCALASVDDVLVVGGPERRGQRRQIDRDFWPVGG